MRSSIVVGISSHFHDSACCVMRDGELVAAAQEERFTRIKHDPALPQRAFRYCLAQAGVTIDQVARIGYYEEPVKKLARQLAMGLPRVPIVSWATRHAYDASRAERHVRALLGFEGPIDFFPHHLSHAASSFYFSDFAEAAILTVDAVGEWTTTSYGRGHGDDIELFEEVSFPHSLGLLYSTITSYLGFAVNNGEYKVMGLAPYGQPTYVDKLRELITVQEDGQFELALEYFNFSTGKRMYTDALIALLGHPPRQPEAELSAFTKDLARSLQVVLEEVLVAKANYLAARVDSRNLCLAGGVALNCVAVGRILRDTAFERVFVQPAAGDAGGCLGAAALAHHRMTKRACRRGLPHVFLGPRYSANEVAALLSDATDEIVDYRGRNDEMFAAVAEKLADGAVVGWFQGRMEFGPRALGARSIVADPRRNDMLARINALIKKREAFRPFAPAVLREHASEHFDITGEARFMTQTCQVTSPLSLPAITHVDGSARVQTVAADTAPRFHHLLSAFMRTTGCPILLNTSFNLRGEPVVCTPLDALLTFIRSELDVLVLEDILIPRAALPARWVELVRREPYKPRLGIASHVYTLF